MSKRILLIGESCVDVFVYGSCSRLCPDVPAQILDETHITKNGGMAMNVRNNIESLGGQVDILTNEGWESIHKTRLCDEASNYVFCRWDSKANIERVKGLENIQFSDYDLCAISDYNKGFLTNEDIWQISTKIPTFLDTKKKLSEDFNRVKYIKVNHLEYTNSKEFLTPRLESKIIETLGPNGCRFQEENFPVKKLEVRSVSGAGDSFFAGLLVEYVQSQDIRKAIRFANDVSSIVITKKGVSTVSLEEAHSLHK